MTASLGLKDGIIGWLLETTWQASVLVGLILLARWVFRKRLSPAWRYGLWMLLVVRLMMPTLPESSLSIFNWVNPGRGTSGEEALSTDPSGVGNFGSAEGNLRAPRGAGSSQGNLVAANPSADGFPGGREARESSKLHPGNGITASVGGEPGYGIDWWRLGMWCWLIGMGVFSLRFAWTDLRFRFRLRRCASIPDRSVLELFADCRETMGLRQPVTLIETRDVATPAVFGLWRKRLLLPDGICKRFSENELRHIFLHELAHLKRRDLEVNWLTAVLQLIHWFNPVIWVAFARMRIDRELATDVLVLERTGTAEREPYGRTIVKLLEGLARCATFPGTVGIAEGRQQVFERIRMIQRFRPRNPFSAFSILLVLALGAISLTGGVQPKTDRVESASAPGDGVFELFLVRAENNQPLGEGHANVLIFKESSADGIVQTNLSFKQGRLQLELGTNVASLNVAVIADGRVPKILSWRPRQNDPIPTSYTVKLERGITVGGVVRDEQGNPVRDVRIRMYHPGLSDYAEKATPRERMALGWEEVHTETTDAEGRWSCDHYPRGYEDVSFSFHHPDYLDANAALPKSMFSGGTEFSMQALEAGQALVVLRKGASVSGRVVDSLGHPIPQAKVFLGELFETGLKTTTDSEGDFQIANAPEGEQKLTVQAERYAPERMAISVSAETESGEITLARGGQLRGVVKDPDGKPVPGVMVVLEGWRGHNSIEWRVDTDSEGRFSWDSAPLDPAEYFFGRQGYTWIRGRALTADGTLHEITLDRAMRVSGTVVDAQTRQPVSAFKVIPGYDEGRWYGGSTVLGKNGTYEIELEEPSHQYAVRIEAEGYEPAVSPWYAPASGNQTFSPTLKKGGSITAAVLLPDGQPAVNAEVALCLANRGLVIGHGKLARGGPIAVAKTDSTGQFRLEQNPGAHSLVAIHPEGYREIALKDLAADGIIRLQPFGRIEGTAILRDKPAAGEKACLLDLYMNPDKRGPTPDLNAFSAVVNDQGKFTMDKVPPGEYAAYLWPKEMGAPFTHKTPVNVGPGKTATVVIQSEGRPVIGRARIKNLEGQIDWKHQAGRFSLIATQHKSPEPPQFETREEYKAWQESYYQSADYKKMLRESRSYSLAFHEDGSFRADDVPAGTYNLTITLQEPSLDQFRVGKELGSVRKEIEVPAFTGQWTDEPYDAGVFEITLRQSLRVGQPARPFDLKTLDARTLRLSHLHGKYVLLDFWATWCGPCVAEQPYLKATWEAFGDDPRFVMIGLSLDRKLEPLTEFVKEKGIPWTQVWLGKWEDTQLPNEYGVYGIPSIILIDPDGKIAATELRGNAIQAALEQALSGKQ